MWDNNAPLQLLKTMPNRLNQDNLEKIQLLIDADKYKNSIISGFDLCGIFAPFCRGCDKTSIYPCAVSYIRMLQAQGMKIEIDASPMGMYEPQRYTSNIEIPQTKPVVQPHSPQQPSRPSYERRPQRQPRTYERYPEPKQPEKYAERYPEPKVAAQRTPVKRVAPVEPVEPVVVVEEEPVKTEIAITQLDNAADIIASIPAVEEIKVEEKNNKAVEVASVQNKVYEESTATVVEEPPVQETKAPVMPENAEVPHEQEKRKLRIAVARRKL